MKYQCWKTTKVKSIENVLKKNSQKTTEIKIEDYHPYITELVQNIPKTVFLKNYTPIYAGELD